MAKMDIQRNTKHIKRKDRDPKGIMYRNNKNYNFKSTDDDNPVMGIRKKPSVKRGTMVRKKK